MAITSIRAVGRRVGAVVVHAFVLGLLVPDAAIAQVLPDLSPLVGRPIEVRTDSGVTVGRLRGIEADRVILDVNRQALTIDARTIRVISRWDRDPVSNGVALGLLAGAAVLAMASNVNTGEPGEAAALVGPPALAAGAVTGWLIDWRVRRKVVVFRASPRATLSIETTGRHRTAQLVVRF